MLERRYVALCQFFKKEVEKKADGALLVWHNLISFPRVCRLLSLLDITEVLSKGLCLEQIGSVTVLHLETLNKRIFESLETLSDTDLRQGENISTRFGPHLAANTEDLCKSPPEFKGFVLSV